MSEAFAQQADFFKVDIDQLPDQTAEARVTGRLIYVVNFNDQTEIHARFSCPNVSFGSQWENGRYRDRSRSRRIGEDDQQARRSRRKQLIIGVFYRFSNLSVGLRLVVGMIEIKLKHAELRAMRLAQGVENEDGGIR